MAKRTTSFQEEVDAILMLNLMLYTAPKEDSTRLHVAIDEMLRRPPWRKASFQASFLLWLHLKRALRLDGPASVSKVEG